MERVDVIQGQVAKVLRDDIDTDQIIPKQFLKRIERTGFGEYLFYDWRKDGEIELKEDGSPILLAGKNFGCGSSRGHAPWALEDFGFRAIIAPSFADIFYSNCLKIGLLPIVVEEDVYQKLQEEVDLRIDLDEQTITATFGLISFEIDHHAKEKLLGGLDDIALTLAQSDAISEWEALND